MSHPARGPDRRSGIDSKASGACGRLAVVVDPNPLKEAA